MSKVATLYHPGFEPEQSWLRAMLLFYDCVHSIVPEKAGYEPSPSITALCKRAPDAFVPIAPVKNDLDYDWNNYHALRDVLRRLSEQGESGERLRARLDWPGGMPCLDLGRTVKVHTDKMADMLAHDLVDFGLAKRTDEEWLRVDRRVADLVLSMLADRMKMNRSGIVCTSSDQETSFAVAAKSELTRGQSWNAEATLASAILKAEIPADIADLPVDRYLDIRKHYEDKREVFRLAMHEIQTLYFERSFQSVEAFNQEINQAVEKFDKEMQKLREQRFGKQVIRWAPVVLGGIVSLAAAALPDPTIAIAAAGVSLTLQVLQTSQGEPVRGTNMAQAQALLVEFGRDLSWNRSWLGRVLSW
jgi:hypothetical protein